MGRVSRRRRDAVQRKRTLVDRILKRVIVEFRAILKRVAPAHYERFPNAGRPCHSCAFNPSTDGWQGFDTTVNGLLKCVLNDQPFYCHEGIPWKKPIADWTADDHRQLRDHKQLCAGFAILLEPEANTEAKRVILAVAREHGPELSAAVRAGLEV